MITDAISVIEFLCEKCRDQFDSVKGYLESAGVNFFLNHQLVRGLDYYNRTTYEIQTEKLGARRVGATSRRPKWWA